VLAVGRDLSRDYATLAAAVTGLPHSVVLVASEKNLTGVSLPPNVDVRLDVSPIELRALYAGAKCVVIPTRAQSFPYGADCSGQTVLLDSLAMARASVVSDRSTLDGYVEHGVDALIVPPEHPESLRATIDRVLADDDLAARLGAAGRAAVEQRFTTRLLAARLAPIVDDVVGRRR
jgi:glycosyltransferase involved in cell wall biosynthesis